MLQGNVDHAESLWIEATINKHPVVFGVVYRKPNTNLIEFQNSLIGVLEKFQIDKKQCILMGDFNINIHADNNDHDAFLTTLSCIGLHQIIETDTRITSTSSSLIDHVYTNKIENIVCSGTILTDISDHLPIFALIN